MKKIVTRVLLVLAMAAGIGAIAAAPAYAAYNCSNQSWVCLFSHQNGGGTRYVLVEPANQPLCQGLPGYFNDQAYSVQNNTNDVVTVFEHGNCTGVGQNVPANNFGNLNTCAFCVAGKGSALKWQ